MTPIKTFLFDIGAVLVDWNPDHLLKQLLPNAEAVQRFRADVLTQDSILAMDRGQSWDFQMEACAKDHPDQLDTLIQYRDRWIETLSGPIQPIVDLKAALRAKGYPVYALSNYGTENMAWSQRAYPFLLDFDGRVISGHVGMIKPEPEIYQHVIDRFDLVPEETLFIDDKDYNTDAAAAFGFQTHTFLEPQALIDRLADLL